MSPSLSLTTLTTGFECLLPVGVAGTELSAAGAPAGLDFAQLWAAAAVGDSPLTTPQVSESDPEPTALSEGGEEPSSDASEPDGAVRPRESILGWVGRPAASTRPRMRAPGNGSPAHEHRPGNPGVCSLSGEPASRDRAAATCLPPATSVARTRAAAPVADSTQPPENEVAAVGLPIGPEVVAPLAAGTAHAIPTISAESPPRDGAHEYSRRVPVELSVAPGSAGRGALVPVPEPAEGHGPRIRETVVPEERALSARSDNAFMSGGAALREPWPAGVLRSSARYHECAPTPAAPPSPTGLRPAPAAAPAEPGSATAAEPDVTNVVEISIRELLPAPAAARAFERTAPAAPVGPAGAAGSAKIAATPAQPSRQAESVAESPEKISLNATGERVMSPTHGAGIPGAELRTVMPSRFAPDLHAFVEPLPRQAAELAAAALAGGEPGAPAAPAAVTEAAAPRVIQAVLAAMDASDEPHRSALRLDFKVGDEDLRVQVQWRATEVRTVFHTDSPELRQALAEQWQARMPATNDRALRIAEPEFASSAAPGFGGAGEEGTQRRDADAHRFELPAAIARGRTVSPSAPGPRGPEAAAAGIAPAPARLLHTLA